jgi:hypothetical protein
MINHNIKAATHRRNWAPAPAIQVGATSDWPITSAKASLANSRAFALGEKDNRTILGGGLQDGKRLVLVHNTSIPEF